MKYYKVSVPALQVYRLHQVEPGMALKRAVFSPDGKVLADAGKVVTEKLLDRFRKFKVRQLVVQEEQIHWVPKFEVKKSPEKVEILEEEKFGEAAGQIVRTVKNTNSIRRMRQVAEHLMARSAGSGQPDKVEELNQIIDRSYELEDQIEQLMDELKTVEDSEAREKIMTTLESTISEVSETFLQLSAPDSLLRSSLDVLHEKEEIRSTIADFVKRNPELIADSDTDKLEYEESDAEKECRQFLERIEDEGIVPAIERLENLADRPNAQKQLGELKERIREELTNRENLKRKLTLETSDHECRCSLLAVLEGQQKPRRKQLKDAPIPKDFVSKTLSLAEEREENRQRLWEAGNKVTGGNLEATCDKNDFINNSRQNRTGLDIGDEDLYAPEETAPVEPETKAPATIEQNCRDLLELTQRSQTDKSLASRLKVIHLSTEELVEQAEQLADAVSDQVPDSPLRSKLIEAIKEGKELSKSDVHSNKCSSKLRKELENFKQRRQKQVRRLQEARNEVSLEAVFTSKGAKRTGARPAGDKNNIRQSNHESSSVVSGIKDQKLRKTLKDGDEYDIANVTGLDPQTVRTAQQVLSAPESAGERLRRIYRAARKLHDSILYERNISESEISNFVSRVCNLLDSCSSPTKLFQLPPDEEQFLFAHAVNTLIFSLFLGRRFELSANRMNQLGTAALVQDLGMAEIPAGLWVKNGSLTNRGWSEVKKHPRYSGHMLTESINADGELIDLTTQHHERLDGSGYPRGLQDEEQHPLTPILAVADSYSALMEPRPHRSSHTPDKALLRLLKDRGRYRRSICKIILTEVGFYPISSIVLLSNGTLARVEEQNAGNPTAPEVILLTDTNRNKLDSPRRLNVANKQGLKVKKILRF